MNAGWECMGVLPFTHCPRSWILAMQEVQMRLDRNLALRCTSLVSWLKPGVVFGGDNPTINGGVIGVGAGHVVPLQEFREEFGKPRSG